MADLVTTVEGPQGKAEIYEVPQQIGGGGQRFEYELHFKGQTQMLKTLGEAYIVAGELAGVPT